MAQNNKDARVVCPSCQTSFSLEEVYTKELEERAKKQDKADRERLAKIEQKINQFTIVLI